MYICFFFNETATTEIYTLSLHDALPIFLIPRRLGTTSGRGRRRDPGGGRQEGARRRDRDRGRRSVTPGPDSAATGPPERSEEHTSELQSRQYLVCRLLLEKKNYNMRC